MSMKQEHLLFESKSPLRSPDGVDATGKDRIPDVNEQIQFLAYLMLENLSEIISNCSLYSFIDAWPKLDKFRSESGNLPLAFTTLPESVTKALNIGRPQPWQVGSNRTGRRCERGDATGLTASVNDML